MSKFAFALQALLGLALLFSGASKLFGGMDDVRADLEIASWFWTLTALIEIVGAVGLLASLRFPKLAVPSGLWVVGMMVGAIVSHVRVEDFANMAAPVVILALALVIVAIRSNMFKTVDLGPLGTYGSDPV